MLNTWRPDRSWRGERAYRDCRVRLGPAERARQLPRYNIRSDRAWYSIRTSSKYL